MAHFIDKLFASIRSGKPLNNGDYMTNSTMLAILGRMASYMRQKIKWEQAMNSKADRSPPRYDWDVKLHVPAIAAMTVKMRRLGSISVRVPPGRRSVRRFSAGASNSMGCCGKPVAWMPPDD